MVTSEDSLVAISTHNDEGDLQSFPGGADGEGPESEYSLTPLVPSLPELSS